MQKRTAPPAGGAETREAVGIFHDAQGYGEAVTDLLNQGFSWQDLSVLAGKNPSSPAPRRQLEAALRKAEDDPAAPRDTPFPRGARGETIGAAIGVPLYLVATATAIILLALGHEISVSMIVAVAAGLLAAALAFAAVWALVKPHDGDIRKTLEKRGGVVLWVQARSAGQAEKAAGILRRHQATNVHMHAV